MSPAELALIQSGVEAMFWAGAVVGFGAAVVCWMSVSFLVDYVQDEIEARRDSRYER